MGSCLGLETDTSIETCNNNYYHYHRHSLATACLRRQTSIDEQEQDLISNLKDNLKQDTFIVRIVNFKRKKKAKHILKKFWLKKNSKYAKLNNEVKTESNNDFQLQNLDVTNLCRNSAYLEDETSVNFVISNGIPLSRGGSSIDLEWEHEYTHLKQFEPFYYKHNRIITIEKSLSSNKLIDRTNIIDTISEKELEASITSMDDDSFTQTQSKKVNTHANYLENPNRGYLIRNTSQQSWSHLSTPESLEWDIDEEQQQQQQLIMEDDNLDDDTLKLLHEIEQLKNRVLCETGDFSINSNISKGFLDELNDNNDYHINNKFNTTNCNNNNNNSDDKRSGFQWLDNDSGNGNCS